MSRPDFYKEKTMERTLVIHHGGCPDGFGAAYAIYVRFRDGAECSCDFVEGVHGQAPPEVTWRDVYVVDFAYPRPVLKEMCRTAGSVTVIDHHITAVQELAGLEKEHGNLRLVFDMDKSGAVLAWEFFHGTPPPRLLLHIQDRDLWRFELDGTNDIHAALMSKPFDFTAWSEYCDGSGALERLIAEGNAINRYRRRMIEEHRGSTVITTIAGYRVPVVNCYEDIMSDLIGELAIGHPFAAGYQDHGTLRKWSLRSSRDGVDVAEIAARFGGGGHPHSAGFTTQLPEYMLGVPDRK